jgi:transcriptional regulator with XRE-family HTH domain
MYHDGNFPILPRPQGLNDNVFRAAKGFCLMARNPMAKKRLASYLRTERKRAGLTQKEIAFLVGAKNRAQISRFERLRRLPTTETLLAFMIVFRKNPADLIPGLYDRLLKLVRLRASELHEELQGDNRQVTKAKLDALETVLTEDERDNPSIL